MTAKDCGVLVLLVLVVIFGGLAIWGMFLLCLHIVESMLVR